MMKEEIVELAKNAFREKNDDATTDFVERMNEWFLEELFLGEQFLVEPADEASSDLKDILLITGISYDVKDYETVYDFLDEYNGESIGDSTLRHTKHMDVVEDAIKEWIGVAFGQTVEGLLASNETFRQWFEGVQGDEGETLREKAESYLYDYREIDDFLFDETKKEWLDAFGHQQVKALVAARKEAFLNTLSAEDKASYEELENYKALRAVLKEKMHPLHITLALKHSVIRFWMQGEQVDAEYVYNECSDEKMFKESVLDGMQEGAIMTVREITDESVYGKNAQMIPIYRISGVSLRHGNWTIVNAKEMEEMHCTHPETGERVEKETNAVFTELLDKG